MPTKQRMRPHFIENARVRAVQMAAGELYAVTVDHPLVVQESQRRQENREMVHRERYMTYHSLERK